MQSFEDMQGALTDVFRPMGKSRRHSEGESCGSTNHCRPCKASTCRPSHFTRIPRTVGILPVATVWAFKDGSLRLSPNPEPRTPSAPYSIPTLSPEPIANLCCHAMAGPLVVETGEDEGPA